MVDSAGVLMCADVQTPSANPSADARMNVYRRSIEPCRRPGSVVEARGALCQMRDPEEALISSSYGDMCASVCTSYRCTCLLQPSLPASLLASLPASLPASLSLPPCLPVSAPLPPFAVNRRRGLSARCRLPARTESPIWRCNPHPGINIRSTQYGRMPRIKER